MEWKAVKCVGVVFRWWSGISNNESKGGGPKECLLVFLLFFVNGLSGLKQNHPRSEIVSDKRVNEMMVEKKK